MNNEDKENTNQSAQEEEPTAAPAPDELPTEPTDEDLAAEEGGEDETEDISAQDPVAQIDDDFTAHDDLGDESTATPVRWAGAVVAVLVIAVGVGFATGWLSLPQDTSGNTVATVNGDTITQGELEARVAQQNAIAQQQGAQAQGSQAVLEQMIDQTLLLQDAEERGISISQDEVESQIGSLQEQVGGEEQLAQVLQQQNLTREELREGIHDQLVLGEYQDAIAEEQGIEATNEEVQALYDQAAANQDNLPALEQVRQQIEQQIVQQKLQQAIATIVEELREAADIDIQL